MHLIAWLAFAPPSHAVDLPTMVPQWSMDHAGIGATDGDDQARDVAIDSTGGLLVVGWLDGDVDHADDAIAQYYLPDGSPDWSIVRDEGPIDGLIKPSSDDRLYDVAFSDDDAFLLAGTVSGDSTHLQKWWISHWFSDHTADWEHVYTDGLSSNKQEARAVAITDDLYYGSGWSFRSPAIRGQWVNFTYTPDTGAVTAPFGPLAEYFDEDNITAAPDQAEAVAVHTDGTIAVVGAVGLSGSGPVDADSDWYVRAYSADGVLLWDHTWAGPGGSDDRAMAAVFDPFGDLYVAGYHNAGSDNGDGANRDWVLIKYAGEGDYGDPVVLRDITFETAEGADEAAYALVLDNADDPMVAGYVRADDGRRVWHIEQFAGYDLSPLGGITLDESEGAIWGIDFRDDHLAIAGTVFNGVDNDWRTTRIEPDSDGDGVGDSLDECPDDPNKVEPGVCDCGRPDDDTDEDGTLDCDDLCPDDPEKIDPENCGCNEPEIDTDGDGTEDCVDQCPDDATKISPGECGCNDPDDDDDGDGVLNCDDACPGTPPGTEVRPDGCTDDEVIILDTGDPPVDTAESKDGGSGCACSTSPASGGAWLVLPLVLLAVRRR
ncbi:MAG: MYXO-CTERM domain-containing protein [Myxococcota bacterium]|jgi:MYXO-CTERM domain-containing protein